MHYYGFQTPIIRLVQAMSALGVDASECCSFGYYWNLSPVWGHVSDRELMVAGADYDHRDLSIADSIASIDVATQKVSAPVELPLDIDFAWWDRRLRDQ